MGIWVILLETLLLTGSISCAPHPGDIIESPAPSRSQKEDPYIVGGTIARPGEAPYQVGLYWNDRVACGGSILSEKWVITAAHCLKGILPSEVRILAGTNKVNEGGQKYDVEKFVIHGAQKINDIALIKVANSIVFNDLVKPITHAKVSPPDGALLTVTGWGATKWPSSQYPVDLYILKVTKINKDECYNKSPSHNKPKPTQLCTFNKVNEGTCYGDSGSPLIYNNEIVAVVNGGIGCARGYPDLQADVAIYNKWIRENMSQND